MSLLLDRDFMEHFELSRCEAKQQLNSAVDAMYDKMMDELKQWITDREVQQNKTVESDNKQSQIPIKMESIVIKQEEVCDCVECINECRIVKRMTKLNKGDTKMSTLWVAHKRRIKPERDADQIDVQINGSDPIGTQTNNSQLSMSHNIAQPIKCQSTPLTQPQDKQILEENQNNEFDDEEEYDQELLDEVKREIEEEMEMNGMNVPIGLHNSQLNLSHDVVQADNCQTPIPQPEPLNDEPQEKVLKQIWNDEFDDIYKDDPEILDQTNLEIAEENQKMITMRFPGPSRHDNADEMDHQRSVTNPIETQVNTSDHKYKCDQCSKSFTQMSNLYKHKLIHWKVYPYKCDQCTKSFNQNGNLQKHKLVHQNVKPFQCDQCSKCFRQKSNLKMHKLIHQKVYPYKCGQCSKSFNQNISLQAHKLMHQNLKPFQCDQCSKCFTLKANL